MHALVGMAVDGLRIDASGSYELAATSQAALATRLDELAGTEALIDAALALLGFSLYLQERGATVAGGAVLTVLERCRPALQALGRRRSRREPLPPSLERFMRGVSRAG